MIIFTKTKRTNNDDKGLKFNLQLKNSDFDITDEEIDSLLDGIGDLDGGLADAYIYGLARMYDLMLTKIFEREDKAKADELRKVGVLCSPKRINVILDLPADI